MFEDEIWNEIKYMRNKLNRFFGVSDFPRASNEHLQYRQAWTEFDETEEAYLLRIEIPGVNKEDIQIHITDQTLVVKAEKKQEIESRDEENGENYFHAKKYIGFYRQFDLPQDIDIEQLSAEYTDGLLQVRLKKKVAKKKTISVN